MVDSIKKFLVEKEGLSEKEASTQVSEARKELMKRLGNGEMPLDLCEELFGIEPDYLEELIY